MARLSECARYAHGSPGGTRLLSQNACLTSLPIDRFLKQAHSLGIQWDAPRSASLAVAHGEIVRPDITHRYRHELSQAHSCQEAGARQLPKMGLCGLHQPPALIGPKEPCLRSVDILEGGDSVPRLITRGLLVLVSQIQRRPQDRPDLVRGGLAASTQLPVIGLLHSRVPPATQVGGGEFAHQFPAERILEAMPLFLGQFASAAASAAGNYKSLNADSILLQIFRRAAD